MEVIPEDSQKRSDYLLLIQARLYGWSGSIAAQADVVIGHLSPLLGQFLETGLADFVGAADRLFDMEMKAQVTGQDLQPIGVSLAASIRPSWPVDGVVGTRDRWQGDVFLVDGDGAHSTTFTVAASWSATTGVCEYTTTALAAEPKSNNKTPSINFIFPMSFPHI